MYSVGRDICRPAIAKSVQKNNKPIGGINNGT